MGTIDENVRNNLTLLGLIAVVLVAVVTLGYQIYEDTRQTSYEDIREIRQRIEDVIRVAGETKSDLRILKADVRRLEDKVDAILKRLNVVEEDIDIEKKKGK